MILKGLFWSGLILLAMLAASAYGWMALPEDMRFPIQWNVQGGVNRYASKTATLIVIPAIAAALIFLFTVAPMIDPRRENLNKSGSLYLVGWIGGIGILALAHFATLFAAITGDAPSIQLIFIGNGLFLVLLGNFMAKSKSNWFAGIKTPWTLSSEHSWSVTNRFAGWGFVITGIATIILALTFDLQKTLILMLASVAATVIVSIGLSYVAWRNDPDRMTN